MFLIMSNRTEKLSKMDFHFVFSLTLYFGDINISLIRKLQMRKAYVTLP